MKEQMAEEEKRRQRRHKMIAPIVITVIFLIYLIVYVIGMLEAAHTAGKWFLILSIPLLALGAAMIYVLVTRIKEIKGGEEDDLSNY